VNPTKKIPPPRYQIYRKWKKSLSNKIFPSYIERNNIKRRQKSNLRGFISLEVRLFSMCTTFTKIRLGQIGMSILNVLVNVSCVQHELPQYFMVPIIRWWSFCYRRANWNGKMCTYLEMSKPMAMMLSLYELYNTPLYRHECIIIDWH